MQVRKNLAKNRSATSPVSCGISILAGGLGRRMGRDKATARLGGRTLLSHARDLARSTGLPVRVIRRDLVPRCGPLGGVFTALKSSRADAELFLPCDMPFLSARLLRTLLKSFRRDRRPAFIGDDEGVGFPFVLPVNCLGIVERQIRSKRFSMQALAAATDSDVIPCPRVLRNSLFNVNTPESLARARQKWRFREIRNRRPA